MPKPSACSRFGHVLAFFMVVAIAASPALAAKPAEAVKPHAIFGSNMVLQRDMTNTVWGTAKPGGEVTVTLGDETHHALVGDDGKWSVRLPPRPAGGPVTITVSGVDTITWTNVLFGDVWLCSGQSNMQFALRGANGAAEAVASAQDSGLRLFQVPRVVAAEPSDTLNGAWVEANSNTVPRFSAVGYFFGRELRTSLNVPIGLIHSSWGGTPAEAWTTRETLEADPELKPIVDRFKLALKDYPKKYAQYQRDLEIWNRNHADDGPKVHADPGNKGVDMGWAKPDFDDSSWQTMRLPDVWESVTNIDGAVWFRKTITIPDNWAQHDLTLSLGSIDDFDVTYFNGVEVGHTGKDTLNWWMAPRRYTVPADLVKPGPALLAVRVFDNFGNGGFTGSTVNMALTADGAPGLLDISGDWSWKIELALDPSKLYRARPPRAPAGPDSPRSPAGLFNGMIYPLIPYGIKGAIWYQGEANAGRAWQYRTLLPAMIEDWRKQWGEGDFPFLIVQLANFMAPAVEPTESAWAELRDAQAATCSLPSVALALAIDIGAADDIHPKNKLDVGKRLALAALHTAYGQDVVYSGPTYRKMEIEGNRVRLFFDNIGGGLVAKDGALKQFAIAGANKHFVWAQAQIDPKTGTVVVWNDDVPNPIAVRYAWSDNPEGCNLYNREGLPAVPFRTDDWPAKTVNNK